MLGSSIKLLRPLGLLSASQTKRSERSTANGNASMGKTSSVWIILQSMLLYQASIHNT